MPAIPPALPRRFVNPPSFAVACLALAVPLILLAAVNASLGNTLTPSTGWRVIPDDPDYPTKDALVALVVIGDTNLGVQLPAQLATEDCTRYFQAALNYVCTNAGAVNNCGGTVFVPPGDYCFSNSLTIPAGVTLEGRWVRPAPGQPLTNGTLFKIYANPNNPGGTPFLTLSGNTGGGLKGLALWYPNQNPTNWVPYPFTISGALVESENLTLVNSYQGIQITAANFTFVSDIYGTPLTAGFYVQHGPSLPRFYRLNFDPHYWAWSGLPGAPATSGPAWTGLTSALLADTNSVAVDIRNTSGADLESCVIAGYCYGIRNASDPTYGIGTISFHNDVATNCTEAHRVEDTAGIDCHNCTFASVSGGIAYHHVSGRGDTFYACTLAGGAAAVLDDSGGTLHTIALQNSSLTGLVSMNNQGSLQLIDSSFTTGGNNITLNPGVQAVTIIGGTNCGPANLTDNSGINTNNSQLYYVTTNAAQPEPDLLIPYPTEAHPGWRRPLQLTLFNVAAYGATGNGVTDDTGAVQAALTAAEANLGGIVFFPTGSFRLTQPLTVSNGVELRGISELLNPNKTLPCTLLIDTGANQTNAPAFVTLKDECGIRGLNLQYVSQTWSNGVYIPYPYTIQCSGLSNYVWDVLAGNSYQVVDFNGAYSGQADGCVMSGLVNTWRFDGGSTNCRVQFGALKPLGFWPNLSQAITSNDKNSISRTAVNYIMADCTNVTINGLYTHDSHALALVLGGDQLNFSDVNGEQLQNGMLFAGGSGQVYLQDAGPANVNHNDGTGSADFWVETNFSGSITALGSHGTKEDENYTLRMDSPTARFLGYNCNFDPGAPLEASKVAGTATLIGGAVGFNTVEVPAGGQFLVEDSVLGELPFVPQAGVMHWSASCQPYTNSFMAAYLNNPEPVADGIAVNASNLVAITVDRGVSPGNPTRDTNGDVVVGWHLANSGTGAGGANSFHFQVAGQYLTNGPNGSWPPLTIEVYFLDDTAGSLAVYYDSTNGLKLGQTYTLTGADAWRDDSFTVNDARLAAADGVDLLLTATGCDPVLEYVAVNSTTYTGVPAQLGAAAPVRFSGIELIGGNVVLNGAGGPAGGNASYVILSTTNLALPFAQWDRLATNTFNADGSFNSTLPFSGNAQQFYLLAPLANP